MIHYRIKVSSMSLGVCQKTWESFKCFQKTLWLDNFLSSISVLSVHSVIDYWYLFFSLAVYHKISTYEFIVSSREQRSEASDVEAGTDKPSSCKRSNKKMFKVSLQQSDFEFVSSSTKDMMYHRLSHHNWQVSRSQVKSWNLKNSKKYEPWLSII